ncbi:radical SAM protein [Phenylobacterium kunshanense]|uniref:Radical SAM core domain-containing protein n=1 Tax=Phenylobacterium kunshanense TaxID=1445034 RepID=A0A328BQZ0_9CAUL|nr:radical SAM protein [Phenylobacterium kunshanense]RAK69105.1 hypothetical protein DJ019_03610 [Phenylobacterium kunshanense]
MAAGRGDLGSEHRAAGARPPFSLAHPGSIEALQVVYKVAERCNINCSYCYYFNMGEDSALDRPARVAPEVTEALGRWLAQGCVDLDIPRVKLSFHGGEPTMMGPRAFAAACSALEASVGRAADLALSIQTNGLLVDEDWAAIFARHRVGVGVSIDGPAEVNDRFRLDRRGRSTHAATERAIRLLIDRYHDGAPWPSTISVVQPGPDYGEVYRYLRGLGVFEMSFLLADRSRDDHAFLASDGPRRFGEAMVAIFHAWLAEDDRRVQVRFIEEALSHFVVGAPAARLVERPRKSNQILIARSDGTVTVDDTFTPALGWYRTAPVFDIRTTPLREVLAHPIFAEVDRLQQSLPTACGDCRWRAACGGGDIENRFAADTGFDNPSVYCDAYRHFYQQVTETLVRNGYPRAVAEEKFRAA